MNTNKINYVEHLNNFAAASLSAGLGPNEIAVYMRIFWKANDDYWPEYIEMSLSELQKAAGINSHHTIIKARTVLQSLGFINFQDCNGKKTKYYITHSKLWQNSPRQFLPRQKMPRTMAKNAEVPRQKMPRTMAKNAEVIPLNQADSRASDTPINYKQYKTNKQLYIEPHENNDFSQVYELYSDNISTGISPVQIEKLAEDIKIYGKSKVMYAILRAAEVNKKTFGYIEGILKNNREGENEGYGKRSSTDGQCGLQEPRDKKWLEQLRHATANQKYPWDNPEEKTNGGN